ncbi:MAG TPA: hypothetical protein VL240_00965 [Candidatus Binatia bacterium]|nr:hypothetical protein [Candidatus Binatia bacterium]
MKRIVLLISFLAVLTLCASAQMAYVNFHEMPIATTPQQMPDNYPEGFMLNWDHFFYVSPGTWGNEGPGFLVDPSTQHNSVAFVGGSQCALAAACFASIKMQSPIMVSRPESFTPISITVTAGWGTNNVTVMAYNNSKFVGSLVWKLTTKPHTFSFPASWNITQLVFTPGIAPLKSVYPAGSMVIYSFVVMKH